MRNTILAILVLVLVGGGIALFVDYQGNAPEAKRERLAGEFLTVLPDSLTDAHRQEIIQLFHQLWARYDLGLVAEADVDTIMTKMQGYIDKGTISGKELVHYMAEVGYKTYAGEEKFRLPSGMVDHPVLNPQSAVVDMFPDTSRYDEWVAERERKRLEEERKKREAADSLQHTPPR
jgi:hypothetical protein